MFVSFLHWLFSHFFPFFIILRTASHVIYTIVYVCDKGTIFDSLKMLSKQFLSPSTLRGLTSQSPTTSMTQSSIQTSLSLVAFHAEARAISLMQSCATLSSQINGPTPKVGEPMSSECCFVFAFAKDSFCLGCVECRTPSGSIKYYEICCRWVYNLQLLFMTVIIISMVNIEWWLRYQRWLYQEEPC